MAVVKFRVDDDLKARAFERLEGLGVTPSELVRDLLRYVAERGELPLELRQVVEEDDGFLATACARLARPQRIKVLLDDL
ncbi:type II toxin-antitoxin system RelB/DinJ family antitoxin [Pseudomonas farsensis]|uniref:Type II toxin-antitoxin system RelB/DinJ family antitoxin n=1 Tax=Pseudomonas farsensis TaxID=2745492 RepID=A0ABU8QXM1_9PSED